MENSISTKVKQKFKNDSSSTSCLYFMGIIGASVHYFTTASSFTMGVAGFLKALVWPAILVYQAFQSFI